MAIEITSSQPAVAEEHITFIEEHLAVELPSQYKAFLRTNNGGTPVPKRFPIPNEGTSDLDYFFFLNTDDEADYEVLSDYVNLAGDDRLPYGLLPIGYDPGGNRVCVGFVGEFRDKIYFWDHEKQYSDASQLTCIAQNLEEFIAGLH
jgi:hypothetical protein